MRYALPFVLATLATGCRWSSTASEPLSGFNVGNAGGIITCVPDAALKAAGGPYFEGVFSTDYLMTYDAAAVGEEPHGRTWEQLRDRIAAVLSAKLSPAAAQSFGEFAAQIESTDPTNTFVWQPSPAGVTLLADDNLEQVPPRNCLVDGRPNVNTVIHHNRQSDHPDKIIMVYDRQRLTALRATPLQFSFLMVHEWLWSLTGDSRVNRTFNRLLQDTKIDAMTTAQVRDFFASFDVYVSEHGFLIPNGPKDFDLETAYKANLSCNWPNHWRSDFLSGTLHVALAPGETRAFPLTLAPPGAGLGPDLCGIALELSYAYPSALGQAFDVKLTRSVLSYSTTVTQGPTAAAQALWLSQCLDPLCAERSGDLAGLVISAAFPAGVWTLTIHNRGTESLDLQWPELITVQMAQ